MSDGLKYHRLTARTQFRLWLPQYRAHDCVEGTERLLHLVATLSDSMRTRGSTVAALKLERCTVGSHSARDCFLDIRRVLRVSG